MVHTCLRFSRFVTAHDCDQPTNQPTYRHYDNNKANRTSTMCLKNQLDPYSRFCTAHVRTDGRTDHATGKIDRNIRPLRHYVTSRRDNNKDQSNLAKSRLHRGRTPRQNRFSRSIWPSRSPGRSSAFRASISIQRDLSKDTAN
jgi:hypothetical protein